MAKDYFTPKAGKAKMEVIDEGDDSKKSYKRLHRWRYSPTVAYGNNESIFIPIKQDVFPRQKHCRCKPCQKNLYYLRK